MARYLGPREKIERRLGEKLGLKGERSRSIKSALTRRPYPPGIHTKQSTRKLSEYGSQLQAKQRVRNIYRMLERQFKGSVQKALTGQKDPYGSIVRTLETRLDNTVFRMGLAQSRDQARQIVNHGHILVNGRRVSIPSYHVDPGDVIQVHEGSKRSPYFSSFVSQWIKGYETPSWISLDRDSMAGTVKGVPSLEESGIRTEDLQSIIEYYSR